MEHDAEKILEQETRQLQSASWLISLESQEIRPKMQFHQNIPTRDLERTQFIYWKYIVIQLFLTIGLLKKHFRFLIYSWFLLKAVKEWFKGWILRILGLIIICSIGFSASLKTQELYRPEIKKKKKVLRFASINKFISVQFYPYYSLPRREVTQYIHKSLQKIYMYIYMYICIALFTLWLSFLTKLLKETALNRWS